MVYGVLDTQMPGGAWLPIGSAPLAHGQICHASVMFHRRLRMFHHDPTCWLLEEPGDWNVWKRMALGGARIGFVNHVIGRHYAEYSSVDPAERNAMHAKQPTADEVLADAEATGADQLLAMA
jgi:hypothetical protein